MAICLSPACQRARTPASASDPAWHPSRSLAALGRIIRLPVQPREVWFEDLPRGIEGGLGPTDYTLVAVMRFDRDELARLLADAGIEDDRQLGSPLTLPWFPPAVKAALRDNGDGGPSSARGRTFDGAPFARGAFLNGSFTVFEGGEYVLLVLWTT